MRLFTSSGPQRKLRDPTMEPTKYTDMGFPVPALETDGATNVHQKSDKGRGRHTGGDIGLGEIDKEATEAMAKQMDPEDCNTLDIVRSGSAWNKVAAYWSGQVEDKTCQLCLEGEENANNF